jgi:hypothetical protein
MAPQVLAQATPKFTEAELLDLLATLDGEAGDEVGALRKT